MSLKMKNPDDLQKTELAMFVRRLQVILFETEKEELDPNKEWDSDVLSDIGHLVNDYGLRPVDTEAEALSEIRAAHLKLNEICGRLRESFVPGNDIFLWYRQIEAHLLKAQKLLKSGGS